MDHTRNDIYSNGSMGPHWHRMFLLSLGFHIAVFLIIVFMPSPGPSSRIRSVVYEVNLVEMPGGKGTGSVWSYGTGTGIGLSSSKQSASARRIGEVKDEETPLVISKKGLKIASNPINSSKFSSSKRIDKELSKIKSKEDNKEESKGNKAVSPGESEAGAGEANGSESGDAKDGINVRVYKIEVRDWVKSKWAYPVALSSYEAGKDLVAIVLLKVKNDGTIMESKFKKRSLNAIFDNSVTKAIERSNPLPPFPEEYRRHYDHIEITFNLNELGAH
jgi:colicin import membrane protein